MFRGIMVQFIFDPALKSGLIFFLYQVPFMSGYFFYLKKCTIYIENDKQV